MLTHPHPIVNHQWVNYTDKLSMPWSRHSKTNSTSTSMLACVSDWVRGFGFGWGLGLGVFWVWVRGLGSGLRFYCWGFTVKVLGLGLATIHRKNIEYKSNRNSPQGTTQAHWQCLTSPFQTQIQSQPLEVPCGCVLIMYVSLRWWVSDGVGEWRQSIFLILNTESLNCRVFCDHRNQPCKISRLGE